MIHLLQDITTPLPVNLADTLKTVTHVVASKIQEDPRSFMHELVNEGINFGLKVVAALVIYFVGAWLIKRVRAGMTIGFNRRKTDKTLSSFLMSFVTFSLYVILAIVTVSTLGINTTSIAALLAAGGMAVGMALSGTVQNFAGGIMLLLFKPFKVGDFIEAQGYKGTVTSISIVNTKITTPDNRVVFIPNGSLSNGNIDNHYINGIRRVEWTPSVEYGSDADACIACIREVVLADKRILDSTTNGAQDLFIGLQSLNENDVTFVVRAWVRKEDYWDVFYTINKALYVELPKQGFGFAYPHVDVTIKN